jgi:hypothetical protein
MDSENIDHTESDESYDILWDHCPIKDPESPGPANAVAQIFQGIMIL